MPSPPTRGPGYAGCSGRSPALRPGYRYTIPRRCAARSRPSPSSVRGSHAAAAPPRAVRAAAVAVGLPALAVNVDRPPGRGPDLGDGRGPRRQARGRRGRRRRRDPAAARRRPARRLRRQAGVHRRRRQPAGRDQLLFVVIVQVGATVQVDTTWADVATGKTVPRIELDLGDDARAPTVFGDAAGRLLPGRAPAHRDLADDRGRRRRAVRADDDAAPADDAVVDHRRRRGRRRRDLARPRPVDAEQLPALPDRPVRRRPDQQHPRPRDRRRRHRR